MRVAYITAGAAGMYCGSCIRDNALVKELQRRGLDISLIPTYTPLRTDDENVSMGRVFFGGINVYLQEKMSLFRHTPWLLDKVLDTPALLNWVSRFSASTSAEDLGGLTVSMLEGDQGPLHKELSKLTRWLAREFKPDLVQLTNSMLAGMGPAIKKEVGVPVLCALQGEEIFLDALIEPYKSRAHRLLCSRAAEIDGFIATCSFYKSFMVDYLQVAPQKIDVVPLGLNLDGLVPGTKKPGAGKPFLLGFFARQCPEKGLHLLIDAFLRLAADHPDLELRIAGYLGGRDTAYVNELKEKVERAGHGARCQWAGELTREQKIDFLQRLDLFSVPAPYKEPKGLSILEAMSCGVPVVQPRHGAYTEMVEQTGGGSLVVPDDARALAEQIAHYLDRRDMCAEQGEKGAAAVPELYSVARMGEKTLEVYQRFVTTATTS
ncbi:Glycosyltransferase family 4 protein [Sulfidibacter corallicola]|uniref:Glycosyltransferase family 4 protein n=1 Tax=Sulfidibacter corallicola TaxID=2818388 RepID=A0A8A4TJS5_SULCO|nr:glycosyltransferase family 4 protein [Sulfidibacter corallicola]QTD49402.1 glycosyltransferase family 4 protein [Sulfidibacter corallicola]